MARNVYFDPFGSYTQGYDTGVQREMQLQKGTRDARDQDYDHFNIKPLELRGMQRADQLGEFAIPYQKNAMRYSDQLGQNSVYNGNQEIAKEFATNFGVTAPYENEAYQRFGITPQSSMGAPQYDQNAVAARDHYLRTTEALLMDPGLSQALMQDPRYANSPDPIQQFMQEQAATTAARFGLTPQQVMSEDPIMVQNPVQQTDYFMQGPNGERVQVGAMQDPRQTLLDTFNRPLVQQQAQQQYGYRKDNWDMQQQIREAAASAEWLRIRQEDAARAAAGGGSGGIYADEPF